MLVKQNPTGLVPVLTEAAALLNLPGVDFAYASFVGLKHPIGIRRRSIGCIDYRARQ